MNWKEWLEKQGITSLKINAGFLAMEWNPSEPDKKAAWDLYVELLTRITVQKLDDTHGDERTALSSIYSLFPTTREIIKENGRDCIEFTKLAIVILNQKIRPFTAKWHKIAMEDGFKNEEICKTFREELSDLQEVFNMYTKMLADMADVEDLTGLEG